jgi:hypothetical protein
MHGRQGGRLWLSAFVIPANFLAENADFSCKILHLPLAFPFMPCYNSKALMCAYSNKEVDFHG